MSAKYNEVAVRALARIRSKGAPISFGAANAGTDPERYDPLTDVFTPSGEPLATGSALQMDSDPMRLQALSLKVVEPVTVLVAAKELGIEPAPGMTMTWAGKVYIVRDCEAAAPDGVPVVYTVIGSRG